MSDWRPLTAHCVHCYKALEGRPMSSAGAMEYRHVDGHENFCFTRHVVRPYSTWGVYDEYQASGIMEDTYE